MINSKLYLQKIVFVVGVFLLFLGKMDVNAVVLSQNDSILTAEILQDSVELDTLSGDSLLMDSMSDSLGMDSVASELEPEPEPRKDVLDAEVQYQARDSIVFLMEGTGFLYGEGKVK